MTVSRRSFLACLGAGVGGALALQVSGCTAGPQPVPDFDHALRTMKRTHPSVFVPPAGSEGGDLAWGTAYVLQALTQVYALTGRRYYADEIVSLGERVLALRGTDRFLHDWDGRVRPVWPATSPYTARRAIVQDQAGRALARFAVTGAGRRDVTLRVVPRDRGFDAYVMSGTTTLETHRALSLDRRDARYAPRALARLAPTPVGLTCQPLTGAPTGPVAEQVVEMIGARVSFAVHTGMIAAPMMEFCHEARRRHPARYAGVLRRFERACVQAWHTHAADLVKRSSQLTLTTPVGTPLVGDGDVLPHNQSLAFARLGLSLPAPGARAAAQALYTTFAGDVRHDGGSLCWPYFWSGSGRYTGFRPGEHPSRYSPAEEPNTARDDASHGAICALSLVRAWRSGMRLPGVSPAQMQETARSMVHGDRFAARLGSDAPQGGGEQAAPLWMSLLPQTERRDFLDPRSERWSPHHLLAAALYQDQRGL